MGTRVQLLRSPPDHALVGEQANPPRSERGAHRAVTVRLCPRAPLPGIAQACSAALHAAQARGSTGVLHQTHCEIAQRPAHAAHNRAVGGSTPSLATKESWQSGDCGDLLNRSRETGAKVRVLHSPPVRMNRSTSGEVSGLSIHKDGFDPRTVCPR